MGFWGSGCGGGGAGQQMAYNGTARWNKQKAFCDAGGSYDSSTGQWRDPQGKVVPDPAGPFNPGAGGGAGGQGGGDDQSGGQGGFRDTRSGGGGKLKGWGR